MSKIIQKDNWRVEVFPRTRIYGMSVNEGQEENICKELVGQIKRHCDEVDSAYVQCDRHPVCSFCGAAWSEDTDVHNGGCCSEDAKNIPEEIEA